MKFMEEYYRDMDGNWRVKNSKRRKRRMFT
jgi:hypothetical protein